MHTRRQAPRALVCTASLWVVSACATDIRREDPFDAVPNPGDSATTTGAADSVNGADTDNEPANGIDSGSTAGGSSDSGETTATQSDDTGAPTTTDGSGVDWPAVACVANNDAVWIFGRDPETNAAVLHTFDPEQSSVSLRAELTCLDAYGAADPVSIAVGRDGTGYVSGLSPGELLTMPLTGADPCAGLEAQAWRPPGGFASLAFRSDGLFEPDTERLFAHGPSEPLAGWFGEVFHFIDGNPVAILDTAAVSRTDLAGTVDGQLFGTSYGGRLLALIDGHYAGAPIQGAPQVADKSFVAWGGAVWVFELEDPNQGSQLPSGIYRYALDGTNAYDLRLPAASLPMIVLDAATSTCAPTVFGG